MSQSDRTRKRTFSRLTLAALLAGALAWLPAGALAAPPTPGAAAGPGTRPAGAPAATRPATAPGGVRPLELILIDLNVAGREVRNAVPEMDVLFDPAKRKEAAPKALPIMKRMTALTDEVVIAEPRAKEKMALVKLELAAMRALLGDAEAVETINKTAVSLDPAESARGQAWQLALKWAAAGKDAQAQDKIASSLVDLARAHSSVDMVAQVADLLSKNAATPTLAERVEGIITMELKGELAEEVKKDVAARQKLRGLVNNHLAVQGVKLDGEMFDSSAWKGKVVLVDFWATWSGPCVARMPLLKKLYADHHAKGLEIVGVSLDDDGDDLRTYLAQEKVPWPQLFNVEKPGVHVLAQQYGVKTLPTMILIDKKGVVRSVNAQEEKLDELVPKLLAE